MRVTGVLFNELAGLRECSDPKPRLQPLASHEVLHAVNRRDYVVGAQEQFQKRYSRPRTRSRRAAVAPSTDEGRCSARFPCRPLPTPGRAVESALCPSIHATPHQMDDDEGEKTGQTSRRRARLIRRPRNLRPKTNGVELQRMPLLRGVPWSPLRAQRQTAASARPRGSSRRATGHRGCGRLRERQDAELTSLRRSASFDQPGLSFHTGEFQ